MNPKLFRAIVVVGAALGGVAGGVGCKTGMLDPAQDLATSRDLAQRDAGAIDLAQGDLPQCCWDTAGPNADLSACIPIACILI